MVDFQYVDSRNLDQVAYDAEALELRVIFKKSGDCYIYSSVPQEIFEEFMNADSKGTFLNQRIKGTYDFRKC